MSNGFLHSVKVPRLYKITAKTVQNVAENGASLKQLIYEKKHPNISGTYGLAVTTLKNASLLDELLLKSRLLYKEKRLDPWLARVLIAELLWRKETLQSQAKPVLTILSYEKELRQLLLTLDKPVLSVSQQVKKPRYVRVNTLVSSIQEIICSFIADEWILIPKSIDYASFLITLERLNGSWFIQDFHVPELLAFPPGTQFHDDPRYKDGSIVLQDKASCLPAFLLKPEPGSTVLDMCAAPGMKTTHLAAIMQNKGKIFAVEQDKRRYDTLCKLVDNSQASCVTILNADSLTLDAESCPDVEYILVDPSCSGSGMSDRLNFENEASKYPPQRLKSLQSFQVVLLRHALLSFPMVKRVVYSTCSIFPEENEMVIDEIIVNVGESYKLKSGKKLLSGNWKNFSSKDYVCKNKCLYAKPNIDRCNGFFVAVFERNFDVPLPTFNIKRNKIKISNDESEKTTNLNEKISKKKRKLIKSESGDFDVVKTEISTNGDESTIEKKKSKKKKEKMKNELELKDNETLLIDEQSVEKKMKKKNKKRMNNDTQEEIIENLSIEEQSIKKKSKKKIKTEKC